MMEDVEMMGRFGQGSSTTAADSSSFKDIGRYEREYKTRLGSSNEFECGNQVPLNHDDRNQAMAEVMFVTVVGPVVTAAPGAGFRVELGKATATTV